MDPSGSVVQAPLPYEVMRKRRDFLAAARGRRVVTPAFMLQALRRPRGDGWEGILVGFTASKKVGGAVARNRAKRRLREVARRVLPLHGRAGWDYVLIGRPEITGSRNFALMLQELFDALQAAHSPRHANHERAE
jgi:ribonuclease P protein component